MIDAKTWVVNKQFAIICTIIIIFAFGFLLFKPKTPLARNCSQLFLLGYSNIPQGSREYNPALDANHNGKACER